MPALLTQPPVVVSYFYRPGAEPPSLKPLLLLQSGDDPAPVYIHAFSANALFFLFFIHAVCACSSFDLEGSKNTFSLYRLFKVRLFTIMLQFSLKPADGSADGQSQKKTLQQRGS